MGRLKSGLLIGSILGAGLMWLNTTKQGRTMKTKISKQAGEVYEEVKVLVFTNDTWKNISKSRYLGLVKKTVDQYVEKYPVAEQARDIMVNIVSSQWEHIQAEMKKRQSVSKKRQEPRQSILSTKPKRARNV